MSDHHDHISSAVLQPELVTVDDLFEDLARGEADEVGNRLDILPTDVMLLEGAGALVDGAASLRYVAEHLSRPSSEEAAHLLELAEAMIDQAARFQHAGDSAALSIRSAEPRHRADA